MFDLPSHHFDIDKIEMQYTIDQEENNRILIASDIVDEYPSKTEVPLPLQVGDTIAVVAPASVGDLEQLERATEKLQSMGYQVKWAKNLTDSHRFFAGDDKARAEALLECWLDPEVKAIWCIRGGYGSVRILEHIDFTKLSPKIFIGMSDITGLHLAISQQMNIVTYLGPNLNFLLGEEEKPFSQKWCFNILSGTFSKGEYPNSELETISPGVASGKLIGGNLALICSLIGTPWQIDTKDKILFLEEVNEEPYRIDRLLIQMKQARLFEDVAGVIIGLTYEEGLSDVFREFFADSTFPVLYGFPSGHLEDQVTLPLNGFVYLDADQKTVKIYPFQFKN